MKAKSNKELKIDAVKMMRDIRATIYEEIKDMTFEQRQDYYNGNGNILLNPKQSEVNQRINTFISIPAHNK